MEKKIGLEVRRSLPVRDVGDAPLKVYDALYYSGKFDPIYRLQGDMVLGAYYSPQKKKGSSVSRALRRIAKELTIDVKEKNAGTEVRVEHLMPTTEEEKSFFREPKTRLVARATVAPRSLIRMLNELNAAVDAAAGCLLSTGIYSASSRIQIAVSGLGEEDANAFLQLKEKHSVQVTASKKSCTFELEENAFESLSSEFQKLLLRLS